MVWRACASDLRLQSRRWRRCSERGLDPGQFQGQRSRLVATRWKTQDGSAKRRIVLPTPPSSSTNCSHERDAILSEERRCFVSPNTHGRKASLMRLHAMGFTCANFPIKGHGCASGFLPSWHFTVSKPRSRPCNLPYECKLTQVASNVIQIYKLEVLAATDKAKQR